MERKKDKDLGVIVPILLSINKLGSFRIQHMIALVQDIHRLFTREKMIKQVKFFNTWPSHVNCPFTTIILDELVAIKVINLNRIKDNVNK